MTKTINVKTYELVSETVDGLLVLDCYKCAAIRDWELCRALGNDCIGKGIWKEVGNAVCVPR